MAFRNESTTVRFGDLLQAPLRNGLYKAKQFHGRGTKIVNMGEMFAHARLGDVSMRRVELTTTEIEKSSVLKGDLLFARRSLVAEGAGRCVVVLGASEPTVFESSIIRARPDPSKVDSGYLYYYFASPVGRDLMRTILRQVAVSGITGTDLAELPLQLPSLETQVVTSTLLSGLDDRIELLRQTNASLEAIAKALFKSWFVDFDPVRAKSEGLAPVGMDARTAALFPGDFEHSHAGVLPRGWRIEPLGSVLHQVSDRVRDRSATVMSAVQRGELIKSEDHFTKQVHSADISKYKLVPPISFAYNPSRINIGSIGLNESGSLGAVSPIYVVVRAKDEAHAYFVWHHLRTTPIKAAIESLCSGSVRQSLSVKDFLSIPVALPTADVLSRFIELRRAIYERVKNGQQRIATYADLRDTLLPRLISGKLCLPEVESLIEDALA